MRYAFIIISIILFFSCKKDQSSGNEIDNTSSKSNFSIHINAHYDGQKFLLNQPYTDVNNHQLKFEQFKFFLGDIRAIKSNGEDTLLIDAALFDFDQNNLQTSVYMSVDTGKYLGLKFGIGIREDLNHTDPTKFDSDNILSLSKSNDMHWSWNMGYIFIKTDGKADTTAGNFNRNFIFHIGTDTLYRTKIHDSGFTISEDSITTFKLNFDVSKLFSNASDTINFRTENVVTHTNNNIEMANRFLNLFELAITKE